MSEEKEKKNKNTTSESNAATRSQWLDVLVRATSETIMTRTNVHVVHNASGERLRKQK